MSSAGYQRWRRASWLAALLLAGGPGKLQATGLAVEGKSYARLLPPRGAVVEPYVNTGYRLTWAGDEVIVEVHALPLGSRAPFTLPAQDWADRVDPDQRQIARLARTQVLGARTEYEAVSRLLGWVAQNIRYELDRQKPQDAASVFERRSGYCTGVARLSVALITAIGIPAREVAGYVLSSGAAQEVSGYHRWIEVQFSDRGWVFSDPLHSHHFVPANYVRLASDELRDDLGLQGLLLEALDRIKIVDAYPWAAPGTRARRNEPRQLTAVLQVEVAGDLPGVVVLTGKRIQLTRPLTGGETTFVGLEPGSYQLRLLLAEQQALERRIEIPNRERISLFLPAAALPAAERSAVLTETE